MIQCCFYKKILTNLSKDNIYIDNIYNLCNFFPLHRGCPWEGERCERCWFWIFIRRNIIFPPGKKVLMVEQNFILWCFFISWKTKCAYNILNMEQFSQHFPPLYHLYKLAQS